MGKVKPYSRRRLNVLRKAWLKRNAGLVAALAIGVAVSMVALTWSLAFVGERSALKWYLLGSLHAVLVGGSLHLLSSVFLAHEGKAIDQLRGAWGEENTRTELERAKRKGLIWDWVDSVTLQAGDIDHLVVTKSGGLVAIDTKWRSSTQGEPQFEMAREAKKVKLRAEGVLRSLLGRESGGHRARSNPLEVTPLVVVWGALQQHIPQGARIDDIEFVAGRELVRWLKHRDGEPVSKQAAVDLLRRVEDFRDRALAASQHLRDARMPR